MDEKLTLMLVEDDPRACKDIITEVSDCGDDFALVGVTNNSNRALQYVRDLHPDAVILDLELQGGSSDGLDFLKKLKTADVSPLPYMLVITGSEDPLTHKVARECGADFIMAKSMSDFSAQSVVDFLKIAKTVISSRKAHQASTESAPSAELEEKRLQRRIAHEMDKVGISAKCIGYRYLVDAISIIMKQPVQHVCRMIGKKYSKTENSVERAMQNAINRAWAGTDPNDLIANYTAKIKSSKGIPTITEFIFFYAQKLNNEF